MRALFIAFLFLTGINAIAQSKEKSQSKPFVLGVTEQLESKVLNETRTLNIYLPEGYNKNDTTNYSVIYLLDGSADEDFIHVAGLVQFATFPWVAELPPTIVVGIANVDRKRDFTFPSTVESEKTKFPTTGHSDKFMSFLETELQPYIGRTYKTNSSKTIIGQSLGGLLAAEILLKKPSLFTTFIIVSPSLWWSNGALLNLSAAEMTKSINQKTNVYIGVGKEGLTPTATPRVMEVDANVLADKLNSVKNKDLNVLFDYLPEEDHATSLHPALLRAFRMLSKKAENK